MVVPTAYNCSSAIMSSSIIVIKITLARSVKRRTSDQFHLNNFIRAVQGKYRKWRNVEENCMQDETMEKGRTMYV